MIKEMFLEDKRELELLLREDIARNYFILLGLEAESSPYQAIYGDYTGGRLRALLFLRKTGTLQFFARGEFDLEAFTNLIEGLDYRSLIGPSSLCDGFLDRGLFSSFSEGAYIARLARDRGLRPEKSAYELRKIRREDLDEVEEIYRECFKSFASKGVMDRKLREKRGRGICLSEGGRIVSLAQSDFETPEAALLVGVATRKAYRGRGLASLCLSQLIYKLQGEPRELFLQYDNLEAGRIYERLGFEIYERVRHYRR